MALEVVWEDDGSVGISLHGILDRDTVPELRRKIFRDVFRKRPNRVRVDVSAVDRMDTAGLALLLEMRNAVKGRGAGFRLSGVTDSVRRLADLARLENLLFDAPEGRQD